MTYNFDEIIDRRGTRSVKLDAMPAGYTDNAVSLWVADMDFAPAQPILDALHMRVDHRIMGYTMYDDPALKTAVTGWLARRYGWTVDPQDIFYCPGIVPAISLLINALTEPGDGVLIQRPVYPPFTSQVENNGRIIYNNPLKYENGTYVMDFADLAQKIADPKVKGMILCSPHNPVGRVWTRDELARLVELVRAQGKWIIADEIHMDLTRRGVTHHPLLTVAPDYAEQIIACTAPTKTFNLAGLCISNIIIPNKAYQAKWNELMADRYHFGMPNPFGIEATIAAYNEGEDWLEQLKTYLDETFEAVGEFCREHLPKSRLTPSEGTYLAWLDVRGYGWDSAQLSKVMLQADVFFNNGAMFGSEGEGFLRINLAAPRAVVKEGLLRLSRVLKKAGE